MAATRNNVTKFKKKHHINIGVIIFGVIIIYIICAVIMYFRSDTIVGYEVKEGSLSITNKYTAFALRNETIVSSNYSGYINYYVQEGTKAAYKDLIFTIDESNQLASFLNDNANQANTLTDKELSEVKNQIALAQKNQNDGNFSNTYHLKNDINSSLFKYANYVMFQNLEKITSQDFSDFVHFGYSDSSGIVTYYMDGYEQFTHASINSSIFDTKNYKKEQFYNNDLVDIGEPIYKICNDENWQLVIKLNDIQTAQLANKTYVDVMFCDTANTSTLPIELVYLPDGVYGILSLRHSMLQYANERYVEIELLMDDETGLKIPLSSIVEKEFYMIPTEYIIKGGKNSKEGVLRLAYDDKGQATSEFVEVTIYSKLANEYYIDQTSLRIGDILIKEASTETFTVTKSGTLIGVYNMNKGYAEFKEISILYQNDEYAIVKPNTTYGLTVYDRIVLDANTVNENDFVYD